MLVGTPIHPQVEVDCRVELYVDREPAPEGRASLVYVDPPASGARVLWAAPRRHRRLSTRIPSRPRDPPVPRRPL